jgi:methylmalonyl-CoA/ethylmalonyl-CoA epimerase
MSGLLGVDHIAIAVQDLDRATLDWQKRYGLRIGEREVVPEQGVEVQMLYAGETRIELVQPISDDSPIHKFLQKNGEGLHHLALAVNDCEAAIEQSSKCGAQMINQQPRTGAHQTTISFVHPKSANGVLLELVEGGDGPWNNNSQAEACHE